MIDEQEQAGPDLPTTLRKLVDELGRVRALGLLRLHEAELETLHALAAGRSPGAETAAPGGRGEPEAVERLLHTVVLGLDGELVRDAALHSFGFAPGTRDLSGKERRERAAHVYRVGAERFRKHQEKLMLQQVARAVMNFEGHEPGPVPGSRESSRGSAVAPVRAGRHVLRAAFAHGDVLLTLHVAPIELVTGVDVLVSSENIYFEMSKTFRRTVSGSLRRAGATKDTVGRITDDVIARQLADWVRRFGVPGLPVAAGTVAVTSPGALSAQGVRRILHAAVATPSATGDGYETAPAAVAAAVRRVFQLAAAERRTGRTPLRSIALPLLGAGRGGLDARTSAETVVGTLEQVLRADPDWSVHLVTRNPLSARAVIDVLSDRRP
ncbi:macro domain-containing protein [Streptomyces europaeiscabiei]|uniref:Macro domain-containing protein n=1 Tax=Streptomyces europaeiscabiei TaxID=146819 RepID=A0ABU4NNB2_9ACTN|nr:macro domain-containing protein [Streptomyces europaeiscabiei]MDX2528984.1 macro domain-containing protein [Streptomyces europaeiscabiei]MDX2769628.1 macro domain-containing protein [Streptomyces europaeiscabiei]MDX3546709.1 macro domain-containing protein [Streptomyces europaeiscabiei]MDX3556403.1 macro domain-containing protein [Streptomyces europaeiscabiei]MDX3671369.1 macro domain-containing protein [Streptomyces europaeiscabiei]